MISKFAADNADVKTTALTICGNTLIPERCIATTKAEPLAVPSGLLIAGSV